MEVPPIGVRCWPFIATTSADSVDVDAVLRIVRDVHRCHDSRPDPRIVVAVPRLVRRITDGAVAGLVPLRERRVELSEQCFRALVISLSFSRKWPWRTSLAWTTPAPDSGRTLGRCATRGGQSATRSPSAARTAPARCSRSAGTVTWSPLTSPNRTPRGSPGRTGRLAQGVTIGSRAMPSAVDEAHRARWASQDRASSSFGVRWSRAWGMLETVAEPSAMVRS